MSETTQTLAAQDQAFQAAMTKLEAAVQVAVADFVEIKNELAASLASVGSAPNVPPEIVADFTATYNRLEAATAALATAFPTPSGATPPVSPALAPGATATVAIPGTVDNTGTVTQTGTLVSGVTGT